MDTDPSPRLHVALNCNKHGDSGDASRACARTAAVCAGPYVLLLDTARARFSAALAGHAGAVLAARFVPRAAASAAPSAASAGTGGDRFGAERELLSCGADATVRVWARSEEGAGGGADGGGGGGGAGTGGGGATPLSLAATGAWSCCAVLRGHSAPVTALAVTALAGGAALAVSASADFSLRAWQRGADADASSWAAAAALALRACAMEAVALAVLPGLERFGASTGAVLVAAGGTDARVRLLSLRPAAFGGGGSAAPLPLEFAELMSLQGHSDWVRSLSFAHHSTLRLLFGTETGGGSGGGGGGGGSGGGGGGSGGGVGDGFLMLASAAQDGKVMLWRISPSSAGAPESVDATALAALGGEASDADGDGDAAPESSLAALSAADFDRLLMLADKAQGVGAEAGADGLSHALLRRPSSFSVGAAGAVESGGAKSFEVVLDSLLSGHEGWVHAVRWHPPVAVLEPVADTGAGAAATTARRWRFWQPPCLFAAGSDKTVSVWQPAGASAAGLRARPGAVSGPAGFEARCWDGVWEPVERVGSGVGGASLGMFGVVISSDARTLLSHGFQGALHVWRRDRSVGGGDGGPPDAALVLRTAAEFDLLAAPGLRAAPLAPWRAAPAPGGHFRAVHDLSWAPSGQYLLSAGADCTTRVWAPVKAPGGEAGIQWHEIGRPQIHGYEVNAVCAAGRAHRFASGADEKVLRVFDAPRLFLEVLRTTSGPALLASGYGAVDDGDFGGGGDTPGAGEERAAFAYVPELGLTNKAVRAAVGSKAAADALRDRFHLDGSDETQRSRVTDARAPAPAATSEGGVVPAAEFRGGAVPPCAFAPPLEEELVQYGRWPEADKMHGHAAELQCAAASSLGHLVASACAARAQEAAAVLVWDARSCRLLQRLGGHKLTVQQLAFSPAPACVEPLLEPGGAKSDGEARALYCLRGAAGGGAAGSDAAAGNDSEFLVTAGRDRQVCVFGAAAAAAFAADARAGGAAPGPLQLLHVTAAHKRQLWAVSFAPVPDSARLLADENSTGGAGAGGPRLTGLRLFATGARDQTVRLWGLQRPASGGASAVTLAELGALSFDSAVTALAFSPVCLLGPAIAAVALEVALLLAVGLESGRCVLVRGCARRSDSLSPWTWACADPAGRRLQGHSAAIRRLAWRPLPFASCPGGGAPSFLELASASDDTAVAIQEVGLEL